MRKLLDWIKSFFVTEEPRPYLSDENDIENWTRYLPSNTSSSACGCCAQVSSIPLTCSCLCHDQQGLSPELDEAYKRYILGLRNDPDYWLRNAHLLQAEPKEAQKERMLHEARGAQNAWPSAYLRENCCAHYAGLQETCPFHPRDVVK